MSSKPVLAVAFAAVLAVGLLPGVARSQSVVASKHDLSSGWGDDACVYCHTPHGSNVTRPAPLWNRVIAPKTFQMYTSPTMNSTCSGFPTGPSVVCLGCHDGTIGYADHNGISNVSDKHDLLNAPGPGGVPDTSSWPNCERCHPEMYGSPAVKWIGTDLRDDHPISMVYPTAAQDPEFNTPPDLQTGWALNGGTGPKLYNGKVECSTCHNVHDPGSGGTSPFLRVSKYNDELCRTCHKK